MAESNNSNILNGASMGCGSDYCGLMQHIGIASLDLRYLGSKHDGYAGIYHTLYDDYRYMATQVDPNDWAWLKSLTGVWGTLALRLTDSPILPLSYVEYVAFMRSSIVDLQTRDVGANYTASFASIYTSFERLQATANHLDSLVVNTAVRRALTDGSARAALQLRQLNDQLFLSERCLLYYQGMPGREWYRHVVWVAGTYDDYGSEAFSAVNDAFIDGVGVGQALALVNLVLDNLEGCLRPPQWLKKLAVQQQLRQGQSDDASLELQPELLDRHFNLPAEHAKHRDAAATRRARRRRFR